MSSLRRRIGVALLSLGIAAQPLAAAPDWSPFDIQTRNKGRPEEVVTACTLNPSAVSSLMKGHSFLRDETLARHFWANVEQKAGDEVDAALKEGWAWFSFSVGGLSAGGTVVEQGAKIAALSGVNGFLTNLGGILSVIQVSMDLYNLDNKAAAINAYKGAVGFAIGRFGSAALQLGSVTFFVVDWSLSSVATQGWDDHTKMWERAYRNYYAQQDKAYANARPDRSLSLSERASAILHRTEAGRSTADWETLVRYYYARFGKSPVTFKRRLDNEIHLYAKRAWASDLFQNELRYDTDSATWTFGGGTSATIDLESDLSRDLRETIERRFRYEIKAMLADDVFPKIARETLEKALNDVVALLNTELKPELNAPLYIYVTVEGLEEPARIALDKPDGSAWYGTIEPGETKRTGMTTLAFIRNGFPDTMRLIHADGTETETFEYDESGTARVHFVVDRDDEDEEDAVAVGDETDEEDTVADGDETEEESVAVPPEGGHWVQVESYGKVWDRLNAHECYETAGSVADGSAYYTNSKPRCGTPWSQITINYFWTAPPATLIPEQDYPISMSIEADHSGGFGGGAISMNMDAPHVACGAGTASSININDEKVATAWNGDSSDSWSGVMTAPGKRYGRETEDGAIRFQIKANPHPLGCYRYIYEWRD